MTDDALRLGASLPIEPPRAERPAAFRRLGLVALYFAYLLIASSLIAGPFVALVSSTVANDPRGDAVLFDPGALMLVEALRLAARGAVGALTASGWNAIFATFLGLLPFAALIAGLGRQGRLSAGYLAARAVRPIGTLALLWGVGLVAQVIFGGLTGLVGAKIIKQLHLSIVGEDIGRVVLAGVTLLVVLTVGVVRDIAAVAAVNDGSGLYTSVVRALRVTIGAFGRVAFAYASRGVLGRGAIVAASPLIAWISRGEDPAFGIPFLIHQAAIVFGVFMHASWLAAAIRLLDRVAPVPVPRAPPPPPPAPAPRSEPSPARETPLPDED
jgi:hypothetical protein